MKQHGAETFVLSLIQAMLPGGTPFFRNKDGAVRFECPAHRRVVFDQHFDRSRGYLVLFRFADTAAANLWEPRGLASWAASIEETNDQRRLLKAVALELARQCLDLNAVWERIGRPAAGVPSTPAGSA